MSVGVEESGSVDSESGEIDVSVTPAVVVVGRIEALEDLVPPVKRAATKQPAAMSAIAEMRRFRCRGVVISQGNTELERENSGAVRIPFDVRG